MAPGYSPSQRPRTITTTSGSCRGGSRRDGSRTALQDRLKARGRHLARRLDLGACQVHVEGPGPRLDPPRLEGEPRSGGYFVGGRLRGECEDGGARAREAGAVGAVRYRGLYDVLEAGDQVGAVGLVQPVLHRDAQEVVLAGRQGAEQQPRAAHVEDGVAVGDPLRQGAAGGRGRDGEVGDGDDDLEVGRLEADRAHACGREGADYEAAEQGGGGVVRVAVQLADDVQEVWGGDLAPEEVVGRDGPSHQRRRAPAEAPGRGDGVLLDEAEVGVGLPDELGDEPGGAVGGVVGVARDQLSARAAHLDGGLRRPVEPDPHAQGEREPHRVVAGAEVGRGGRDADGHHRMAPSSSAPTASKVAGTGSGSSTRPSTASGSLSPCPVRTLTTVPPGPRPSRASLRRPAIPAAEAGSQKTPSSRASKPWASRISSSVTLSMPPPDSRAAANAPSLLAGDPMRIALATVSGLSKSWPATSGEAPSAWKPSMREASSAYPASRHSVNPFQ